MSVHILGTSIVLLLWINGNSSGGKRSFPLNFDGTPVRVVLFKSFAPQEARVVRMSVLALGTSICIIFYLLDEYWNKYTYLP